MTGIPLRSWLRMRFLRAVEPLAETTAKAPPLALTSEMTPEQITREIGKLSGTAGGEVKVHTYAKGERLDHLVRQQYGFFGHPAMWRTIATYNSISDPLKIPPGTIFVVSAFGGFAGEKMNRQLTTLPQINIETDGSAIKDTALVSLTGVRVQQKLSLPALCELTFLDADGLINPQDFLIGSALKVRIDGFDDALFNGQITAVEYLYEPSGVKKIRLRGYDKLHLLRKSQSVRAFVQVGLRDLISELTENLSIIIDMSENTPLRERYDSIRADGF